MRELRQHGSVRGAASNGRPYREPFYPLNPNPFTGPRMRALRRSRTLASPKASRFWFSESGARLTVSAMRFEASTSCRLLVRLGYAHPTAHPWLAPCSLRVLRGGSWNNNPQNLRSANRNRNTSTNRNNNRGFRLASTLTGRIVKVMAFKSDHELRPGPVMMIKRASGLHVVGAPPSCGTTLQLRRQGPGRRPPHA